MSSQPRSASPKTSRWQQLAKGLRAAGYDSVALALEQEQRMKQPGAAKTPGALAKLIANELASADALEAKALK